jgi:hypothetical protein
MVAVALGVGFGLLEVSGSEVCAVGADAGVQPESRRARLSAPRTV